MKRLVIAVLLLTALASAIVLLPAGPGAQASPGATITVNTTADTNSHDGVLTLREAMMLATTWDLITVSTLDSGECAQVSNSTYGPPCSTTDAIGAASADTIIFDAAVFPLGAPSTITVGPTLPTLSTGNDTVDGSSAGVIVDGLSDLSYCFWITSNGNAVRGLEIYNCFSGVLIGSGAQDNTIGGSSANDRNIISGNHWAGVQIEGSGSSGNRVIGNYIGTNAAGDAALPNQLYGVFIWAEAQNNTVGGSNANDRNIISGNTAAGISIADSSGNHIEGNLIGTNADGSTAIPNDSGVQITADNNVIGGSGIGEGNLISGNDLLGIWIPSGYGNQVLGNKIGTNLDGSDPIPNRRGVQLGADIGGYADGNVIGGSAPGEGNLISGNSGSGIIIGQSGSSGNQVKGNKIGTSADGLSPVANSTGVVISYAPGNVVGGVIPGEGNTIAYNTGSGVMVKGATATGNTISGNSIHSNGDKGIETISGGNTELARPIIESGNGSVCGHTEPKCYPCTVEVFSDDEDEGRIYHGSTTTNDDAEGTWCYAGAVNGPNVTATITDEDNNTSEFSPPFPYGPGPCADVDCDDDVDAVDAMFILQYVVGSRSPSDQCPPPEGHLYLQACVPVDCDSDCDAVDAMFVLQHVVGLQPELCVCPGQSN